jgi:formylglycine-generating enzyme required for sulfatase activity
MPRCPVCQNRYASGRDKHCPICGWDLQTHPFYLTMVPEVAQKENARLAWAIELWSKFKLQQEQLKQAQKQIQEADRVTQQFHSELQTNRQEQSLLSEASHQQETRLVQLQAQLDRSNQILGQLQAEIEYLKQGKAHQNATPQISESKQLVYIKRQELSFQIAIVDAQGQIIHRNLGKAQFFDENLGNGVKLSMICIPGGTFLMGSPEHEAGRESHESPQHLVTISEFCLSRFPITQAQWQAIAALPQIDRPLNPDPSNFKGSDLPVEQVSWYDAVEFCARLAQLTKREYRLPSEAQWEYACRGGTTTPFYCGETLTSELANYDGSYTYRAETEGLYRQQTTPMGNFQEVNPFGLWDLHGNVWEWCADSWHEDYQNAPTDGGIWQAEILGDRRVLRGGSWYCLPDLCRSAQRHWDRAVHGGSGTSFRVVCSVPHFDEN